MSTTVNLAQLLVCRELIGDAVLSKLGDSYGCAARLIEAAETHGLSGNLLRSYLLDRLTREDNLVSRNVELSGGRLGISLRRALTDDLATLEPLLRLPTSAFLPGLPDAGFLDNYQPTRPFRNPCTAVIHSALDADWTPATLAETLVDFYTRFGNGVISHYRAFRWDAERGLLGIDDYDPVMLRDLVGYASQKQELTANTLAFLSHRPANNVLLVGERGTGKSSAVKALANEYCYQGLRLLQLTKSQLPELPRILAKLRNYATKRFIIFLDDLSFESGESDYKPLKSAIEGGVETRPDNVLIYATSNRRHLIRETWRDRETDADDLHGNDSVNEAISLSDRFGLIISYRLPNQNEYLAIIDHHLRAAGVILTPEELRLEGQRWEMSHSGRSGRIARQFVNYYLGQRQ